MPRSIDDPLDLESRQRRRDAERAGRGARRRGQARRLRRIVVGVRRHADLAEARGHADRARCRRTRCRSSIGEQYLQLFTRLYGLETVTIRYFNVFGPRQDPSSPYSGVISLFIRALIEGKAPTIHGDGEQTRDFTYVANVVDGVLRAVEAPGMSRRGHQRRDRHAHLAERLAGHRSRSSPAPTSRPSTARPDTATCAIRRPTSRKRSGCSATARSSSSKKVSGGRSSGTGAPRRRRAIENRSVAERSETVVIGAGPAGASAARLLAAWGHDVRLITRPSADREPLAESLPPSCREAPRPDRCSRRDRRGRIRALDGQYRVVGKRRGPCRAIRRRRPRLAGHQRCARRHPAGRGRACRRTS